MTLTLFRHPLIRTGTTAQTVTGLLVGDGRIVAAGDARELAHLAAPASVVDLPGAVILPGLIDAHIHTAQYARRAHSIDLRAAGDLAQALALISDHLAGDNGTGWVLGGGWDANRWRTGRPDRAALDRVCPDRPVLLGSIDEHSAWANSEALRRSGITAATADPPGGRIERDADGEPTGILREAAAGLGYAAVQQPQDLDEMLATALNALLAVGVTGVHDIDGEDAWQAFSRLHAAGRLPLRVHKAIRAEHLDLAISQGRRTGDGDDWLSTGPVKIFADGALGSHTCQLTEPFAGEPENTGIAVTSDTDIERLAAEALDAGLSVATHAIGDRANQRVLDSYERLLGTRSLADGLRLRIEHAQYVRPADISRMAALGVVVSMQPTHCTTDFELAEALLAGHDIASYAWRELLAAGVPLAFGSDAPVEDPNPFHAVHAAVTRQRADGTPAGGWQPWQRLTVQQALAAHTFGSAYAAAQQDRVGRLAPGYFADFVAVDRDVTTVEPAAIRDTGVACTVVGGQVRWSA